MKPAKPISENPAPLPVLKGVQSAGGKVTATFETADGQSITTQFVVRPKGAGKRGPLKGTPGMGRPELPKDKRKIKNGVSMLPSDWQLIDQLRGEEARGDFIGWLLHEESARRSAAARH